MENQEQRLNLSFLAKERLKEVAQLLLHLTRGTVSIFDNEGQCTLRLVESPYCKKHNAIYKNQCEGACWSSCAERARNANRTITCKCLGGLDLHATPIVCAGETLGILTAAWGELPPELVQMADKGKVPLWQLEDEVKDHIALPAYLKEAMVKQLEHCAQTLGNEVIRHRDHLLAERKTVELSAMLEGTKAIVSYDSFEKTARAIFDCCTKLTGATAGYVALLSDDGSENEVLFLEAGGRPCSVDPELPMPIRGLRAVAYHTGKAAYDNDFWNSKWMKFMPKGHVTMDNVLFAPLNIAGKTVGIMGIANKPGGFTENDAKLATVFGEMAAIALNNSRTRDALEASTKKFSALFDNMLSGFAYHKMLLDSDGKPIDYIFLDTNDAFLKITGLTRDDLLNKPVTEVLPSIKEDNFDWIGTYGRVALTGEPISFEQFSAPLQRWFTISAYSFEKDHFAVIIDDITGIKEAEVERRRIEARILESQKLESLGLLAGGVAHDFNNLLVAILGNADLALHDMTPNSPNYDCLSEIIKASTQAADLCKQMLAYSGKGRFILQDVNLNDVISEMSSILLVSLSQKASLQLNLAPQLPAIEADITQIRQLLMNTMTNASEALGEETGYVSVTTGAFYCDRNYLKETFTEAELPEGEYVYVDVADSGCGMDEETKGKIFEPFFSTKFTGRGLGLAAIHGIVRGHNGAIKVYSEKGKGTTFKVLFPALGHTANNGGHSLEKAAEWKGDGTVLLVDDEPSVIQAASRMIKKLGFEAIVATNGAEAVKLYKEQKEEIRCILLDLTMPVMDGKEAFRKLRSFDKKVQVILSSGYNEQEATQLFIGKGLAGFIQKPYRLSSLRDEIRRILDKDEE